MATVIQRADGRFEIRESLVTPKGPRSRTLAIFSSLSVGVLDRAQRRATRPFDRAMVRQRAMRIGAPWTGPSALAESRAVLAALASRELPATFVAALRESTASNDSDLPDTIPSMLEWIGASDEQRGRALRELLRFADRVQRSRGVSPRRDLFYPPIRDL